MALIDELKSAFYDAKKGDIESLDYLREYFISNVRRQLKNMNLPVDDYNERIGRANRIFHINLSTGYEANTFIDKTLEDLKKVIYLGNINVDNSSKDVYERESSNMKKAIAATDLNKVNLPIVYREIARMFCEDKSVEELSRIFKCSKTMVYYRLRKVADACLDNDINKRRTQGGIR